MGPTLKEFAQGVGTAVGLIILAILILPWAARFVDVYWNWVMP